MNPIKALIKNSRNFLLFANGAYEKPEYFLNLVKGFDCLIGVDGGTHFLMDNGITPHLVVGDLDSLRPQILAELQDKCLIHRDPDQSTFDLEKAVNLIRQNDGTHIVIAGATGKRLDHSLANLMLLSRFAESDIKIIDTSQELFFIAPENANPEGNTWKAQVGTPVSLLPFGEVTGVTSKGLRYECLDLRMNHLGQIGSSNEMSLPEASVSILKGTLLVIVNRPV